MLQFEFHFLNTLCFSHGTPCLVALNQKCIELDVLGVHAYRGEELQGTKSESNAYYYVWMGYLINYRQVIEF